MNHWLIISHRSRIPLRALSPVRNRWQCLNSRGITDRDLTAANSIVDWDWDWIVRTSGFSDTVVARETPGKAASDQRSSIDSFCMDPDLFENSRTLNNDGLLFV
jgi:hypothetical protein